MLNSLHSIFRLSSGWVVVLALFFSFSLAHGQFTLLYQKDGPAASSLFGWSVAGAGDVDGDGVPDFIVGAPHTGGYPIWSGSAYVYSGATGALLYQKDGSPGDELGYSVAGAGDLNSDSKADFIVGAPFASPGGRIWAGTAYVFSGPTGALIYEFNNPDLHQGEFGWSVAGAGDVDGDGRPDLIVGAHSMDIDELQDVGSAFIYSGAAGALLGRIDGPGANKEFGFSVAGCGDVNGDGRADVIIGAAWADPGGVTDAGSAYVYSLPCVPIMIADLNTDNTRSSADLIILINNLFKRQPLPPGTNACSSDLNKDSKVSPGDIVLFINHLFKSQALPYESCGC